MPASDFEMTVSNVFVLAGRGIVAAGEASRGEFHNGEAVQVWHRERLLGHSIAFVELHTRPGTLALILTNPNVRVEPGFVLRSSPAVARAGVDIEGPTAPAAS